MCAVAQEGEERRRGRGMKGKLRNKFGKRGGCGGRSQDVTVFEALFLSTMAELGGAYRVPEGDGGKVRQSSAAGEQSQSKHTAQQNAPREAATAAEMGMNDHERCF